MALMSWQALGTPAPDQLPHTREQLHCVAQVIASVPRLLATPQDDWGHQAFDWDGAKQTLFSVEIPGDNPFRVGLRLADATALVVTADGTEVAAQATNGLSTDDLFAWLSRQTVDLTGSALPKPLAEAEDGLPEPCVAGQTFDVADGAALAELARYYANSYPVLQRIVSTNDHAAPVRTWPHHMDMATLISLDPSEDPETARSVSFGMQPGDGSYAEPYYYSSPWPYPEPGDWPALEGGGAWHTEGFTAAVLVAPDLIAAGEGSAQQTALDDFARSAVERNRALLS
jgi:hypothetical protein